MPVAGYYSNPKGYPKKLGAPVEKSSSTTTRIASKSRDSMGNDEQHSHSLENHLQVQRDLIDKNL